MNRQEIIQWVACLRALHNTYEVPTELRILKKNPEAGKAPYMGVTRHFKTAEGAADFVQNFEDDDSTNYYAILNPITPAYNAANDASVLDVCWLPIDIDPIRREKDEHGEFQALMDKKVPSSDEELASARQASLQVQKAISGCLPDSSPCVIAESGNGCHLLYRVKSNGNVKETSELIHGILEKLRLCFIHTPFLKKLWVDIDRSVSNPARIWKLYGTEARKGTNSPERPWRIAKVTKLEDPLTHTPITFDELLKLDKELGEYLAEKFPESVAKPLPQNTNFSPSGNTPSVGNWIENFRGVDLTSTDIVSAAREAGILRSDDVRTIERTDGTSTACIPVTCPNHAEHSMDGGIWEAAIMLPTNGQQFANFHCQHDHCLSLKGSETAYNMLGADLVRKHSTTFEVEAPLEMPPTSTFEPTRKPKEPTGGPEYFEAQREKAREEAKAGVEHGPVVEPWIDPGWMRQLPQIMVKPLETEERETLVEGLIKRGEVCTLQATTKVGKTFALMHQALAWSHGKDWMGFKATRPLRVLFIDPELLFDEGEKRFRWVALNVLTDSPATDGVTYVNLRGKPIMASQDPWGALMIGIRDILAQQAFDIIIIDSIYQYQGDRDPNASNEVVRMMNQLRVVTESAGSPAVLYVHHFAKGNPAAKTGLDRAAGSYAFNAAADNVFVISPHAEKDHFTLEFFLRHHASPDPMVGKLRQDIRLLDPVDGLDPKQIDVGWAQNVTTGEGILRVLLTLEERAEKEELPIQNSPLKTAVRKRLGLSDTRFTDCMAVMVDEENVRRVGKGAGLRWELTNKGRQTARHVEANIADVSLAEAKECDKKL